MWEKIRVIWQIPELRTKILLTLVMLAIYRVGFAIQLPIIDQEQINRLSDTGGIGQMMQTVAMLSASQLKDVTIFGLGISILHGLPATGACDNAPWRAR